MKNFESTMFVRGLLALLGGIVCVIVYLVLPFSFQDPMYQFAFYFSIFICVVGGVLILIARFREAHAKDSDRSLMIWFSLIGLALLILFFVNAQFFPPSLVFGLLLVEIGIYEIFLAIKRE